jgi:AraC-like DNA-binding protein
MPVFKLKKFQKDIEIPRIANVHYFEFLDDFKTQSDSHDFYELVYVDNGHMAVEAENYKGILTRTQMIVHTPNETHRLICDTGCAPNIIIIGFECKGDILERFSSAPVTLSAASQNILAEVIKEARSVFLPPYDVPNLEDMKKRNAFPFGADQLIKSQLEYFFIKLIRESNIKNLQEKNKDSKIPSNIFLHEICEYIHNNIRYKIRLDTLCMLFATNKTTLSRLFKNQLGCTIIDYVNRCRIKESKMMMRQGYSITQISDELNLNSVHYFSRLFVKYEKMPASKYLQTLKSKFE